MKTYERPQVFCQEDLCEGCPADNGSFCTLTKGYTTGDKDYRPNTKEGSNFKIDWAVDSNGTPADLDQIDFVKIMTAVNQDAGQMGEISTEVTTVENLHFKK